MLSAQHFRRALTSPLSAGATTIAQREGFYLHPAEEPNLHLAEVSPLPPFSRESLEEVTHALEGPISIENLLPHKLASLRFAGSCLQFLRRRDFASLLESEVDCNVLVSPHNTTVVEHFRVLKTKLGPSQAALEAQLQCLAELLPKLAPDCRLRLDFNGNPEQLDIESVLDTIPLERIDYIEDPFTKPEHISRVSGDFPIAFDDLLSEPGGLEVALSSNQVRAVVLKPQRIGSFEELHSLAERATLGGKQLTLTSLLETELGLSYCFLFAAALQREFSIAPCGFLTLGTFKTSSEVFRCSDDGVVSFEESWKKSLLRLVAALHSALL